MGELVSSYDDGEKLTVTQQERFKVVFTRLFYFFSTCLSASVRELPQRLNEFRALGILD